MSADTVSDATKTNPSSNDTEAVEKDTQTTDKETVNDNIIPTDSNTNSSESKDTGENNTDKTNGKSKEVKKSNGEVTEEGRSKIVKQIEYYFGNYNLPRDKFLSEQVKLDDGWISLETMVKFKRLSDITTDFKIIKEALKKSELIEIDAAKDKIRRSQRNPLPYFGEDLKAETVKRTIYLKGLPKDGSVNLDKLLEHFKPYSPFETIHLRQFFDQQTKKQGFKGSILIVFPDEKKAQEFMDIDDIAYEKKPLLRKWHANYLLEKEEEIKERKARKAAKQAGLTEGGLNSPKFSEVDPLPRGTFLFSSGYNNKTTREDIKAELQNFTDDVAFLDFAKGKTEAYIRLATAFNNKDVFEAVKGKLKVNDCDIEVRLVEGDEETEQIKKAELAKTKIFTEAARKRRGGHHRGHNNRNKRRKY